MRTAALVLVGLVALQRLVEMVWSRRNQRLLRAAGARPAPDPVFPAMVLAHVSLLAGCALEPALLERSFVPWIGAPALVLFALAQALRLWVLVSLGSLWNVRIFDGASAGVVARGPYRWIRHPNYLAVVLEFATLPLVCSAWITLALANAIHVPVLARRIRDEERVLLANPEYRATMGTKPRLVPGSGAPRA